MIPIYNIKLTQKDKNLLKDVYKKIDFKSGGFIHKLEKTSLFSWGKILFSDV